MLTLPARLQSAIVSIQFATEFNDDSTNPAFGAAFKWAASLDVSTQSLGIPLETFTYGYDATYVEVGNWVATTSEGKALKISEIVSLTGSVLNVILEDVGSYNAMLDTTLSLDGSIASGPGIIFTLNEFGLPILGPFPDGLLLDIAQSNIEARFNQISDYKFGGTGSEFIGKPDVKDYTDGAFEYWTDETKISNAFQDTTNLLNKIIEPGPTKVKDWNLFIQEWTNFNGFVNSQSRKANGFIPNNSTSLMPAYTDPVNVAPQLTFDFQTIGFGLGNKGKLDFAVNGANRGSIDFSTDPKPGVFTDISLIQTYAFGTIPDYRFAFDASYRPTVLAGLNQLKLTHSFTGSKTYDVVVETLSDAPVLSNLIPTYSAPTIKYSSGVPHIDETATISVQLNATNMVGKTFKTILFDTTVNDFKATELKLTEHQYTDTVVNLSNDLPSLNVPVHVFALPESEAFSNNISINAYGPLVKSTTQLADKINAVSSKAGTYIQNTPTPDSQFQNIKRMTAPTGARPTITQVDWATNFNDGSGTSIGDLKAWEAPTVGGRVVWSKENYGISYFPVGPDFSSKPDTQYATFKIQKKAQHLTLTVNGQYRNMYVMLPGVPNDIPNLVNGWMDASKKMDYPATLWPGHPVASDGCLVNKTSDYIELTFGSMSSANSTDNLILVQFELAQNDFISELFVFGV